MTTLHVKNISSSYEGQCLLKNITFHLNDGEILCLLGPSGSGKTTLLRLLAGLENEDSGTITFNGVDIQSIPPHKRNFGMMFQDYALFPHKNVYENVAFGLKMQKLTAKTIKTKVDGMLKVVGLDGFGHRPIDELSGGEQQRVALARSLAPQPQLLLLDEPLGSLDRTLRDRLSGEIRSILKDLGVTALFVTHDQTEAFTVADKIAVLYNGRLEQFDSPESLYRTPANTTVASFLGFKNIVSGQFDKAGNFCSPMGHLHFDSSNNDDQVCALLIRPEGARINKTKKTSGEEFFLSGKVIQRQFQGATYKLQIQVGEQILYFDLPIDPSPPEIGKPVHLTIRDSSLVWIDEEAKTQPSGSLQKDT